MSRPKKYTIIDGPTGEEIAQAGPLDARLWPQVAKKAGRPVRVERTNLCPRCQLHRCGGGTCQEGGQR